jgi:hypothetical protein
MQRSYPHTVHAPPASSTENSLQLLFAAGHGLANAPLAAPPVTAMWAPSVLGELGETMAVASGLLDWSSPSRVRWSTSIADERRGRLKVRVCSPSAHYSERMFAYDKDGTLPSRS